MCTLVAMRRCIMHLSMAMLMSCSFFFSTAQTCTLNPILRCGGHRGLTAFTLRKDTRMLYSFSFSTVQMCTHYTAGRL